MNTRTNDPDTSHAAAGSVDPDHLRRTQRAIHRVLRMVPSGLTDEDIAGFFPDGMYSASGLRTRRSELVAAGLVRDSGRRRPLRSGRNGIVWEAVDLDGTDDRLF